MQFAAATGCSEQQSVLDVARGRGRQRLYRQGGIATPQPSDQVGVEAQRRAVVPVGMRMAVALLLAGVHAVGHRRIQQRLASTGAAHEAAAAHEDQRVGASAVDIGTAALIVAASDVVQPDTVSSQDGPAMSTA